MLPGGRGLQGHGRGRDVAAGIDDHRPGEREVAAQGDVARRGDRHLFVVGGRRGQAAAHHALDDDVLALQGHQRAGLEPAATLGDRQRAVRRGDVQPSQPGVALADDAVDQHVVQAGQHDAPAGITGDQLAGPQGGQTGLGAADRGGGARVDDDVALGFQAALDLDRLLGVDDDVGVATQRHQLALEHGVTGRAQEHAAAERLQTAARGELDVLRARGARQGVEGDRLVGTDVARHRHRAGFQRRVADDDLGAALAGVDGGQAFGGPGTRGRVGVGDLGQAQALGTAAGHAGDGELVSRGDQMQPAFGHLHQQLCGVGTQRCIQRRLDVSRQIEQIIVVGQRRSSHGHRGRGEARAQIDRHRKLHVTAGEFPGGQLRKAVRKDLFLPRRQHHGHVARGAQLDLAVFAQRLQTCVTTQHDAVVQPGLGHGGRLGAGPAAHLDELARNQALAQVHLALGVDHDLRIAVEVAGLAAQEPTGGVLIVDDLATGDDQAEEIGIAQRVDDDAPILLRGGQAPGARQLDARAVGSHAAVHSDQRAGTEGAAALGLGAVAGQRQAAQVNLPGRAQRQRRVVLGPGHGLGRLARARRHDHAARRGLAHEGDAAHGVDLDGRPARSRATQRTQAACGRDDHAPTVVVGAGRGRRLESDVPCGRDRRVHQDALPRSHVDGCIVHGPHQALVRGVVAPGHDAAVDLHVLAALQHDAARAARRVKLRRRVHVQTGAPPVVAQQVGAVRCHPTQQRDRARNGRLAFPVGEGVGLDEQVRTVAHQIDGAADDGGVLDLHAQVGVGLQRRQRAGHQEAEAPLSGERMRFTQLEFLDHAVVVAVVGIDDEELLGVLVVGHQPAVGLDRITPAPGHALVQVVTTLALDEGLAHRVQARIGLVVDRAEVGVEARRGEYPRLLLRRELQEGGAGRRHVDIAPVDGGVDVVTARPLLEAHPVGLVSRLVEDRPAPPAVARSGDDDVLLRSRQVVEGQAVQWLLDRAPVQRGLGGVRGAQARDLCHHAL